MLKVGSLTETQSSNIFTGSDSITLTPVVSAEWNHNLFNPPYVTTAGTGAKLTVTPISPLPTNVTSGAKPNFTTKSFSMSGGKGKRSYTVSGGTSSAYKIVTYVKTNSSIPTMVTASAKGTSLQYGSEQAEADSLGWTKVVTYVGSESATATFAGFVYTIAANSISENTVNPTVFFTVPEVYATTHFDYHNHSLFPTEIPFTYFRPGESYVSTGDTKFSFPTGYRKITSSVLSNYTVATYSPVSPILQNPKFFLASSPVPVLKNALPTDISPYRYFVSDTTSKSISAIYEKDITTNKIVIKFNTLMTVPSINIAINGSNITVDGSQSISLPSNSEGGRSTGVLTLYWNGTGWTKTKWSTMPQFTSTGSLSLSTLINKITVTQISKTTNPEFSSLTGATVTTSNIGSDLERMQVVEISPRLEIDLTDFVENISIDKSLDGNNSALPISSLNTNDAQITLSGIPAMNNSTIVPIFSSQSDQSSTILANMLRKNIKFYINFNLEKYYTSGSTTTSNTYIPGGVFYSDSWSENDIQDISVQCFDISRYLQSTPVPDYVANLKNVFDIITNILDLSGFTDYDYDSLYAICNSRSIPLDLSYYYCNSKDSTIVDALNQIFVAYQIGAFIDEYGIMRFLSLQNILSSSTSNMSISESNITQGGFSVSTNAKPGKISLRYQTPKVKQSPSLQNVQDISIKNSPSFIYTTSNDVVWSQQTTDSVGFNYLDADMAIDSNTFKINNNDLLDIFHTFNMNNDGFAFIENEIVSFVYKEYRIETLDGVKSTTVSIKNNLELTAEIDRFIKQNNIGLRPSSATITGAVGNGTTITYTSSNSFKVGDKVMITGINPLVYNIQGEITERTTTSFKLLGKLQGTYVSGGEATISADYDVKVTPTGNINNVQRGLFGTSPSAHARISSLSQKGLKSALFDDETLSVTTTTSKTSIVNDNDIDPSLPSIDKIKVLKETGKRVLVFPTSEVDEGYKTYSVKFEMSNQDASSAGLFFNMEDDSSAGNMYFVELIKIRKTNPQTQEATSPARYQYQMVIWKNDKSISYWSDVTGECNSIISNFSKIIKKQKVSGKNEYTFVTDNAFNLKVVYEQSNGANGEVGSPTNLKNSLSIFLNNVEITGWQQSKTDDYDEEDNPDGSGWKQMDVNSQTGMKQKPYIDNDIVAGTKFGFFATVNPILVTKIYPETIYWGYIETDPGYLREIHATARPLVERSVNYFYQDREFLNAMIQDQPIYTRYPTYMMQTTPEISGINYYDVQYETPAAVSVDILPIEYLMKYFPGNTPEDQTKFQRKIVDEYSLSYSTPMNTGFRARMIVANSSPNMVFLKKDADELNDLTVNFNLWTHEIVAPSDPEIIEKIIDYSNLSEVVQLDSEWIQSKQAAQRMLKVVQMGIEGFSKNVSLKIFGNPLVQVGDIVTVSYSLNGINQQRYLVHSISQSFSQGLETSLQLKRIQE